MEDIFIFLTDLRATDREINSNDIELAVGDLTCKKICISFPEMEPMCNMYVCFLTRTFRIVNLIS